MRRALASLLFVLIAALPAFGQTIVSVNTKPLPTGCTTGQVPVYSTVTGLWSCGTSPTVDSLTFSGGQSLVGTSADVTELLRTTNAQTFSVYGTFTNASNYRRLSITTISGSPTLNAQGAGTGAGADLHLATGGTVRWNVTTNGHLVAFADNTYDIGASGATRPRTGHFGTSVVVAGASIDTGNFTTAAGQYFIFGSSTRLRAATNGNLSVTNFGETVGFLINGGADGVMDVRTRANADTATVKANAAQFTGLASVSGTRYVCSNTTGVLSGSASACSGTEPLIADFLKDGYVIFTAQEAAEVRAMLAQWKQQGAGH